MTESEMGPLESIPELPQQVCVEQLKTVLEQLERLEDGEEERRKNADARLTSVIAIMPLVVALATSGMFPLIQNVDSLGKWRFVIIPLYLFSILCFLAGILWALRALWPLRGKYMQSKIGSISKYRKPGSDHRELLLEMIETQRQSIKHNQGVNGEKLGEYMESVTISASGLAAITVAVLVIGIGLLTGEVHPPKIVSAAPFVSAAQGRAVRTNGTQRGSAGQRRTTTPSRP